MIKAIETKYKGYRFRSRGEARWAVFFDTLEIKYEYEREGFDLGGTLYLPDFWLPELETWLEVKGESPTQEEIRKCILLAQASKHCVLLAWNLPGEADEGQMLRMHGDEVDYDWINLVGHWWYACAKCRHVGVSYGAKCSTCKCADWSGTHNQGRNGWVYDNYRIEQAYKAARQSRFEHGENPSINALILSEPETVEVPLRALNDRQ